MSGVRSTAAVLSLVLCAALPASAQAPGDIPALEERLREARARLDATVTTYEATRTAFGAASQRLFATRLEAEELEVELRAARQRLRARAGSAYNGGRLRIINAALGARSLPELIRVISVLNAVLNDDAGAVDVLEARRAELHRTLQLREEERLAERRAVRAMDEAQAGLLAEFRAVKTMLTEAKEALEEARRLALEGIDGFIFPVLPPYSFIDSFGAPRHGGRSHEGTDIFAPRGTPVVAVVDGVVEDVRERGLGGKSLWVKAADGFRYYYAHLDGYAPDVVSGRRVTAGTELGYVGDTGNAKGTSPHLHFEISAPSGEALNPYPTLAAADTFGR